MSVSARSGVTLGENVKVDLEVTPQDSGDIECELHCNNSRTKVIYRATGEVDFDQYPYSG